MCGVDLLPDSGPPSAVAIPTPPASEEGKSREIMLKFFGA